MLSAVRLPTPPPPDAYPTHSTLPLKRSPPSRSPSPDRRRPPPRDDIPEPQNEREANVERAMPRERELTERFRKREVPEPKTEAEKLEIAKAEYNRLLSAKSGGTYVPPQRLRMLQAQLTDKSSKEYQRMAWDALKKSINGLINKVNVSNIKSIALEIFGEDLIKGRGAFARSITQAQRLHLPFTPVYAALVAVVNSKLPQVGELLLHRLIVQFKKAFKRNDKAVCLSSTTFLAQLCNVQVTHELLPAQILLLLLHRPNDDSVEVAVGLTREVGAHLEAMNPQIFRAVMDQFRTILHEADLDKRQQYSIEVLFQVVKDKFKDNPAVREALDILDESDQITHRIGLDDEGIETKDTLNVFKYDPKYEENEQAYQKLKAEILGEQEGSDEDEYESGDSSEEEEDQEAKEMEIKDETSTQLVNLRRTIYLTIMSSSTFEEATHKLMKINLPPDKESELVSMIIEVACQEKTYSKFHGLIGERLAKLNRLWTELFERAFAENYDTIHRRETSQLRNNAKFWGHMLSTDAITWHVLSTIHLNEDETTSSSRIFIKILMQDLAEALGMPALQRKLKDPLLAQSFEGIFPMDNPRNTRFSINYFTSIGMGGVTEEMREQLKNAPKPAPIMPPTKADDSDSVSSYSSYSSYTGSSRSYSHSRSPSRVRPTQARDDSPPPRRRQFTPSRSRTPPRTGAGKGRSRTPPHRGAGRDRSRTPPRRLADRGRDRRSPPPRSPPRRNGRARSYTPSDYSRSPPPRRETKRSPSCSSRSRTPPRRDQRRRRDS